jgi:ADP-ribosylglycohydrolase
LGRTLDDIRPHYHFDVSCQGSVPEAIIAFLESTGYEDAIRNAVSIGGDSDTLAAITGGIAEAAYGIPDEIEQRIGDYLTPLLMQVCEKFTSTLAEIRGNDR